MATCFSKELSKDYFVLRREWCSFLNIDVGQNYFRSAFSISHPPLLAAIMLPCWTQELLELSRPEAFPRLAATELLSLAQMML